MSEMLTSISVQQQREDRARKDGRQRNNRNRNLLIFSAYDNATLFPDAASGVHRQAVIGVQLGLTDVDHGDHGNLVDPVNVVLKVDDAVPGSAAARAGDVVTVACRVVVL